MKRFLGPVARLTGRLFARHRRTAGWASTICNGSAARCASTGSGLPGSTPWVGTELPCDKDDMALFAAATTVAILNGATASFWHSSLLLGWLGKNRMVKEALTSDTWISDLTHGCAQDMLPKFLTMHRKLRAVATALVEETPDTISWNMETSGRYSTKSAYNMQFQGRRRTKFYQDMWKVWAPGKIKMFAWLMFQNRLWCNDRLQRRGWPNKYFYQLCVRNS